MISITHTELRGDYRYEGLVVAFEADLPGGPLTGSALLEYVGPGRWELPADRLSVAPDRWICPIFQAALRARVPHRYQRDEIYREIRKALACVYH